MKLKYLIILLIGIQACGTVDISKRRYSRGFNLQQNHHYSKAEKTQIKAIELRLEEKKAMRDFKASMQELKSKALQIQVLKSEKLPIDTIDLLAIDIEKLADRACINGKKIIEKHQISNSKSLQINNKKELNILLPKTNNETLGATTNLGYLGVVLIVVGLVFLLLGVAGGVAIVSLGVILIILAYFLG